MGTAEPKKIIVMTCGWGGACGPMTVTCTVGGSSASLITSSTQVFGSCSESNTSLFSIDLNTETSEDVVVTHSARLDGGGIAIYKLVGAAATNHDLLTQGLGAGTTDLSGTIDCPAGGVILGMVFGTGHPVNYVWTGLTEDNEYAWNNASPYYMEQSVASDSFATTQTGRTISVDDGITRAVGGTGFSVCSYGPA